MISARSAHKRWMMRHIHLREHSMSEKKKLRVATTSLAGCFGCHMSFLDIDERILTLLELIEFDRSPLTDIKHCGPCDIGLIEGGVCNADNVHVLDRKSTRLNSSHLGIS